MMSENVSSPLAFDVVDDGVPSPAPSTSSSTNSSFLDHFDIDDEILRRLESLQSHTIAGVIVVMILVIVLIVDVFCYVFNQWGGLWLIVSYCCGRRRLRMEEKERLQAASRFGAVGDWGPTYKPVYVLD